MRLTKEAIQIINNPSTRLKIAMALSCTEQWVIKLIGANKLNGPLTTHSAMAVIKDHTKKMDSEILESEGLESEVAAEQQTAAK